MHAQSSQPGKSRPEDGQHMTDEPDIGSGEKTPGERETEEDIRQIPPLPDKDGKSDNSNKPA